MRPKKVDQLGGIESFVVGMGLDVCCALVEVGLVSRRGCSRDYVLRFGQCIACDPILSRTWAFGYFAPVPDGLLLAIESMSFC